MIAVTRERITPSIIITNEKWNLLLEINISYANILIFYNGKNYFNYW